MRKEVFHDLCLPARLYRLLHERQRALSLISNEVTETLNGEYEVTLVHPIDEAGKWQRLVEGCILRVPVPIGMTPYVNLSDTEIKVDKTTRGVWRITSTCCVRSGPDNGYKIVDTYSQSTRTTKRLPCVRGEKLSPKGD